MYKPAAFFYAQAHAQHMPAMVYWHKPTNRLKVGENPSVKSFEYK